MRIGMNLLLWTNHVTEVHLPLIETLKRTGYQGVELPLGMGDQKHYQQLGEKLKGLDLGVTAVTSLTEETNIASTDKMVRQRGLDRLRWAIDMAEAAGAELICGPFHSAFAYFTRKPPTAEEQKWSTEMLYEAGLYAQKANITLALEALNRFECYLYNTMADLKLALEEINLDNVGATYDSHHSHIEEKNHAKSIAHISPYLKHVHISESDRGTPGSGQVQWATFFNGLKETGYNNWLTIEAFDTSVPDFANAINVWRDFSPTNEVYQEGYRFISKNWT